LKLYDLQRVSVKRAFRVYSDEVPIKSISFHPSGDFIAIGTIDKPVRLYDVKTTKVFATADAAMNHTGGVRCVRFQQNGKYYATGSSDGCVKIWDTTDGSCVRTIDKAHGGTFIASVQFTKNGQYILTSGQDAGPKLWEVSSGKLVNTYEGASMTANPISASFSWNEEYVVSCDEKSNGLFFWCSRTGKFLTRYGGHTEAARVIVTSPVELSFMSCSEDMRARYWYSRDGNLM
jgi:cleavage stimulation factor subunit 1